GRRLVELAVRDLHIDRHRILGTAPEALASAVRSLVALEIDGSSSDVSLSLLGVPPAHVVVPWEEATVGGLAFMRVLDEPRRRRRAARVATPWPPGHQTLAAAAVQAAECVAGRSLRILSCFVGPDDSGGMRTRAAAVPVRLSRDGIAAIVVPSLN